MLLKKIKIFALFGSKFKFALKIKFSIEKFKFSPHCGQKKITRKKNQQDSLKNSIFPLKKPEIPHFFAQNPLKNPSFPQVTIIPQTSAALGFAQYSPRDDKHLYSKDELFDRMCMMLGGRCAENLKFGRITSGAQDDLQKVTKSAYAQVKLYGMSSIVGPLSFPNTERFQIKPYLKKFASTFDQEATLIVAKANEATTDLIKNNMDKLETVQFSRNFIIKFEFPVIFCP